VSRIQNPALSILIRLGLAAAALATLVACTHNPSPGGGVPFDPYEAQNRQTHAFNKSLDRALVRPVGKGFSEVVPDDIETLVSRFAFNLSIPASVVNNTLKGDMKSATEDLYRFAVNSTLGLGGFFDPATDLNMPAANDTDFGQTLHAWGVPQGAYIELPVLGPSTERDTAGRFVDLFTNPLEYIFPSPESYYVTGIKVASRVGERGRYADTVDSLLYDSADSYAQIRSLYLQNRDFELGNDAQDAYLDPYDDPNQ
jgi:phospholipid-binding lipoprotein MlaA